MTSQQKPETATRTLEGMINAAYKISKHLPASKQGFAAFTSVKSWYFISKDFSASVVREFHLKASNEIHFFEISIGAEPDASPMEYLLDINFQVRDASRHGQYELAYLLSLNKPHQKGVVIYFLPFIDPNEPQPRITTVTYMWPNYFKRLETKLQESLTFSVPLTGKDIGVLECEVYLEPGSGKKLVCSRQGSMAGRQQLEEASVKRGQSVWSGWKYRISPAPAGEYALALELTTI